MTSQTSGRWTLYARDENGEWDDIDTYGTEEEAVEWARSIAGRGTETLVEAPDGRQIGPFEP
jgi:hypothetical protein